MGNELTRRSFLQGALATTAGAATLGLLGSCAPASGSDAANAVDPHESSSGATEATDWLGEEPDVGEPQETVECEVLVIGAGSGGMVATMTALEMGFKTITLEKTGAASMVRDDIGGIGTKLQQAENNVPDAAACLHYLTMYAANDIDQRLVKIWLEESAEAVDWYADLLERRAVGKLLFEGGYSADFSDPTAHPKFPTGHSPVWNDPDRTSTTVWPEYVKELGGDIRYQTSFVKFEHDDHAVTAALAKDEDERVIRFVASKGIILATGGYQHNIDMLRALQPQTLASMPAGYASAGLTAGDGIKACLWMAALSTRPTPAWCSTERACTPTKHPSPARKGSAGPSSRSRSASARKHGSK